MRRAEGLVDVGVVPLDQSLYERRVVRLLARVEAQVLGQRDARAQRTQPLAHRVHLPARVRRARRAAEVRRRRDLGALVEKAAQRRQRGVDAEVVGHGGLAPHADVERDVEVDPHEHPPALQGRQVAQERDAR